MTSLVQRPPCNPRTRAVVLCALALVFGVALLPLAAQDVYGPWQVRRGRTTDCKVAGGYPKWNVTFSGDRESPTVVIDGDTTGDVRGTVLIGRLVPGATDSLPGLRFAYATRCSDPNRCGRVELVVRIWLALVLWALFAVAIRLGLAWVADRRAHKRALRQIDKRDAARAVAA